MFISKKIKSHLFFNKLISFFLLANLIVLPLVAHCTHICFTEVDAAFQHNTHSHQHDGGDETFAKGSEYTSQLCYACIYSATLSVLSPFGTHPGYSVIIETLNSFTEQILAPSYHSSQADRAPPSVMA